EARADGHPRCLGAAARVTARAGAAVHVRGAQLELIRGAGVADLRARDDRLPVRPRDVARDRGGPRGAGDDALARRHGTALQRGGRRARGRGGRRGRGGGGRCRGGGGRRRGGGGRRRGGGGRCGGGGGRRCGGGG